MAPTRAHYAYDPATLSRLNTAQAARTSANARPLDCAIRRITGSTGLLTPESSVSPEWKETRLTESVLDPARVAGSPEREMNPQHESSLQEEPASLVPSAEGTQASNTSESHNLTGAPRGTTPAAGEAEIGAPSTTAPHVEDASLQSTVAGDAEPLVTGPPQPAVVQTLPSAGTSTTPKRPPTVDDLVALANARYQASQPPKVEEKENKKEKPDPPLNVLAVHVWRDSAVLASRSPDALRPPLDVTDSASLREGRRRMLLPRHLRPRSRPLRITDIVKDLGGSNKNAVRFAEVRFSSRG